MSITFSLRTSFAASHNLDHCFSFSNCLQLFWFLHWFLQWPIIYFRANYFISTWFCLWRFSAAILLYLISSLSSLWSEKMFIMISVFLNLLRLALWPNMWYILKNFLCPLEKIVYSAVFGWNFCICYI